MSLKELGLQFSQTKSEKSFNDLYKRIKPGLINYINTITKDRDDAEDIFSMVMSTVYNKIHMYNSKYHISTWIYRIAYTHALVHLRNKKRAATTNFSVFDSYYDNDRMTDKIMYDNIENDNYTDDFQTIEDKELEMQEQVNLIHEAIDALDTLYRDIVKDRLIHELSYNEIAKKHKLPLHTIKNRINRGKRILQKTLGNI